MFLSPLISSSRIPFIDNESYSDDKLGHGTSIAGVIGAQNNNKGIIGVAPDSEIYSVKVIDSIGKLSDLLKGIEWSIENNMNIIVLSLGVSEDSPALKKLVDEAYLNNILVIAASGKDGQIYYPAKYSSVIAVGSVNENNELGSENGIGEELELVAPGENILSTNNKNEYSSFSGTSMATPHVVGVVALLKENNPSLTTNELRAKLQRDAIDLGNKGKDNYFGYGLVNINIEEENLSAIIQIVFPEEANETKKDELEINPIKVEIIKIENEEENIIQTLFYNGNQGNQNITIEPGQYKVKQYFDEQTYENNYNISEGELIVVPLHKVNPPVHQWIAYQAKYIWSTNEINFYLPQSWTIDINTLDNYSITYGTRMEDDESNDIYSPCLGWDDSTILGFHPYCNHFWSSPYNLNSPGLNYFKQWDSAYERAQILWDDYVLPYYNGIDKYGNPHIKNKTESYYWLGRVAHLLEDMSVPAHVHRDIHIAWTPYGDDSYEDYVSINNHFTSWLYSGSPTTTSNLFNLFYDMAERSDDFDSDDVNGEVWNGIGRSCGITCDISDTNCQIIGNTLMPESMRHVAGLYQLFWASTYDQGCPGGVCCNSNHYKLSGEQPTGWTDIYVCSLNRIYWRDYYCNGNSPNAQQYPDNLQTDCTSNCKYCTNGVSSGSCSNRPLGYNYDAVQKCSGNQNTYTYGLLGEYLARGYCDGNGNDKYTYTSSIYDATCDPDDDNDGVLDINDLCQTISGPSCNNGCPDITKPITVINNPLNNSVIKGNFNLQATITESCSLNYVRYKINGNLTNMNLVGNIATSSISSLNYLDGKNIVEVLAYDNSMNVGIASITLKFDNTGPAINVPLTTQVIEPGYTIPISISDNTSIQSVWYQKNNINTTLTSPYQINTTNWLKGVYNLIIYANDTLGNLNSLNYLLTINNKPIITSSPIISTNEDSLYSYQVLVNDIDGDTLTYNLTTKPIGMTISNSGLIQWTPDDINIGNNNVAISVSDGNFTIMQSYILNILPINDPPILSNIPNTNFSEDSSMSINLNNYVADKDNLDSEITWTYSGNTNIKISISNGIATITANPNWNGQETITFTAKDPGLLSNSDSSVIKVNPINDLPTITITSPNNNQIFTQGDFITFTGTANDIEDGIISNNIEWVSNAQSTLGIFSTSNLNNLNIGKHIITAKIKDSSNASNSTTLIVYINPIGNTAPTANAGADQSIYTNNLVTLDGSLSSDSENNTLTYLWTQTSGPNIILSNNTNLKPTFTPTQDGTYIFNLIVNDGILNSNTDSVAITSTTYVAPSNNGGGGGGGGGGSGSSGCSPYLIKDFKEKVVTTLKVSCAKVNINLGNSRYKMDINSITNSGIYVKFEDKNEFKSIKINSKDILNLNNNTDALISYDSFNNNKITISLEPIKKGSYNPKPVEEKKIVEETKVPEEQVPETNETETGMQMVTGNSIKDILFDGFNKIKYWVLIVLLLILIYVLFRKKKK